MNSKLSYWIVSHRWKLFAVGLVILAIFCMGLGRVQMTSELRSFMDKDHQGLAIIDEMNENFEIPRSFLVFVYQEQNQLNSANLALIDELALNLELGPFVSSVRSLANSTFIYSEQDDIHIETIFDRDEPNRHSIAHYQKIQQWLLKEPTLVNSIISADATMSAIVLNTSLDQDSGADQLSELRSFIVSETSKFTQNNPQYRIAVGGDLAFDLAEEETMMHDLQLNMGASLLLIFVILLILFRSISSASFVFLISIAACICAIGFAGYVGLHINNINLTAPIIVLVVAVLDGIHFINIYQSKRTALRRIDAIQSAVELTRKPITLTTITTATGFMALNVSSSPAISSLGTISAVGIVMAWVFTFSLLPALAVFIKSASQNNPSIWIDRLLMLIRITVINHSKKIIGLFALAMLLLITQIPRIIVDDDLYDSLDGSLSYVKDQRFVQDKMYADFFTLYFDTRQVGGIHNANFLSDVDQLAQWVKSQDQVINTYSYVDHIKRINQSMNGDKQAFYKVPQNDALVAQYGLLYDFSIPSPDEISRYTDLDQGKLVVSVLTGDLSRGEFNQLVANIENKAQQLELADKIKITGWAVVFNAEIMAWISELIQGFGLAFLLISLQMFVFFRSFKLGLICLIPNLLPIGITLGLWGLAQAPLGFISLLVLSVAFGIVIDDTIHFMSKFTDHFKQYQNARDAIEYAFKSSGRAIIVTTIALAIGLSPMLFSNYVPLQGITKLIAPIAIFALITDLFLLPAILLHIYGTANKSSSK